MTGLPQVLLGIGGLLTFLYLWALLESLYRFGEPDPAIDRRYIGGLALAFLIAALATYLAL